MDTEPAPPAPAGWYPDFWTPSRKRYWTGAAWTYATVPSAAVDDPAPEEAMPLPEGHGLPAPVVRRPDAGAGAGPPEKRKKPILWAFAVVVGLLVGLTGIYFSNRSSTDSQSASEPVPSLAPGGPSTTVPLSAGNDASASALEDLIVTPDDVPSNADVVVFPGGIGLDQPTLDLCNGRYPSESRRTARFQDAVLDPQGAVVFSTEAVLYGDSRGTTQAFAELQSVVAACPATPVPGAPGDPAVTTTFSATAPDANWAQTPTVNRKAYDLTSDDGTGPRRTVAVYLQRGRVLLGVYSSKPDGAQLAVGGQTTMEGIVGVFAKRLAALPTSVVGS